jgi:hypothetical protein
MAEMQGRTKTNVLDMLLAMRLCPVAPAASPCDAAAEAIRRSLVADDDNRMRSIGECLTPRMCVLSLDRSNSQTWRTCGSRA